MAKCRSFSPLINKESKILILGSMPGIKSLEATEYYAHPQNRFWKIIGKLYNNNNLHLSKYNEKTDFILLNKLALWDVINSCKRIGSLDSAIKKESPNNIELLLKKYPNIKKICLNGNKAYSSLKKHFPNIIKSDDIICTKLPSTSPANARWKFDLLYLKWENEIFN